MSETRRPEDLRPAERRPRKRIAFTTNTPSPFANTRPRRRDAAAPYEMARPDDGRTPPALVTTPAAASSAWLGSARAQVATSASRFPVVGYYPRTSKTCVRTRHCSSTRPMRRRTAEKAGSAAGRTSRALRSRGSAGGFRSTSLMTPREAADSSLHWAAASRLSTIHKRPHRFVVQTRSRSRRPRSAAGSSAPSGSS